MACDVSPVAMFFMDVVTYVIYQMCARKANSSKKRIKSIGCTIHEKSKKGTHKFHLPKMWYLWVVFWNQAFLLAQTKVGREDAHIWMIRECYISMRVKAAHLQ